MLVHIECVSFLPENRIILVKSPWTFESHSEHCLRKIYSGRYFWDQYWLWHWLNVFDLSFKHSRPQVVQPQGNRGGKIGAGVGNPLIFNPSANSFLEYFLKYDYLLPCSIYLTYLEVSWGRMRAGHQSPWTTSRNLEVGEIRRLPPSCWS